MHESKSEAAKKRFLWKPTYAAFYLLTIVEISYLQKGMVESVFLLFFICSAIALVDLTVAKDHHNALANWVLVALLKNGMFLWYFATQREWVGFTFLILAFLTLAALFAHLWKRYLSPSR